MKDKVRWIVDTYILNSPTVVGDLLGAIRRSGAELHETKYIPFAGDVEKAEMFVHKWIWDPVVLYGTHGFLKANPYPYIPGGYGLTDQMHCSNYYSNIPSEWMLNDEHVMTTFAQLTANPRRFFSLFNYPERLFVRPNNGFKTFAGMTITLEDAAFELSSSMQLTSVMSETIVLVAPARKLTGEFRFIIGDGEVIDGSEYRWDSILDIRHDWPQDAWDLADKMAKHTWQPDTIYTCDVATTEYFGPRIIEINSFACAGLYACDKDLVVNRVNEIALKEFRGEI